MTVFTPKMIVLNLKIVKKILKHLNLWDVKRKPPPRANDPPTEAIIIYDESSSPSADDPPSISSAQQVPLSALLFWRDTSAFGPVPSARHVT
jgi:hypothetical protein